MNRRKLGFLFLLLIKSVFLIAACQPSPEEEIIIGKDQFSMISETMQSNEESGNTLSTIGVPDSYTYENTGADGNLIISTDASVILPDAETLPIAKVVPGEFTQEMVSGMLEYLFGDTPYYLVDNSGIMTKEEIETGIVSMQASIADGTYVDDAEALAVVEKQIEMLKERYDSAPETRDEPILSNGIMIEDYETGASYISVHSIDDNSILGGAFFTCKSSADFSTSFDSDTSYMSYSDYSSEDDNYITFTMDGAIRVYDDLDISNDLKAKLGVTLSDAKKLVQGFFDAASIEGMYCGAAYVVDDHGTGHVDNYFGPATDYAIKLYYSSSVNGSPVLTLGELGQSTATEYDYIWMYESFEVLVTDGGIIEIIWNNPCAVSEIVTKDTNIIVFEQATKIFEEKIMTFYEAKLDYYEYDSIDIDIEIVELGLLRIKQQNAEGTKAGLYVPVWAFFGEVTSLYSQQGNDCLFYNDGCDYPDGPYIVLAINAIDGSIIDLELGY